jgi:hypothetical protein
MNIIYIYDNFWIKIYLRRYTWISSRIKFYFCYEFKIIFFNKCKVRPMEKICYINKFLFLYLLNKNLNIKYNVTLDKYATIINYIICFITNLKKNV